jgi:hypothetical protein
MIEHYRFGSFTFQGERHKSDAIIHADRLTSWWRAKGHSVAREDLESVLAERPGTLVIGTGAMGLMKVPDDTRRFIEDTGIQLVVERTADAVKTFNRLQNEGADVAIAMHLTC